MTGLVMRRLMAGLLARVPGVRSRSREQGCARRVCAAAVSTNAIGALAIA